MIFPFDAAYAQEVLRAHYDYADALSERGKSLAAKASGLVAHDHLLNKWDVDEIYKEIRRQLSRQEDVLKSITIT